jgi:hypothetical protein
VSYDTERRNNRFPYSELELQEVLYLGRKCKAGNGSRGRSFRAYATNATQQGHLAILSLQYIRLRVSSLSWMSASGSGLSGLALPTVALQPLSLLSRRRRLAFCVAWPHSSPFPPASWLAVIACQYKKP